MTAWRSSALALSLLLCLGSAPPVHADDGVVPSTVLFAFEDDEVFESSGLVDRGGTVYTVNDSGDDAVVYGVDADTGRTVSRTTYADDATDVEALAPGEDGTVWAGDTGDNRRNRDTITAYRLRPQDGDHPGTAYPLRYPDGAHDAETLLVQPGTERVFVVSKSPFGGTVYAAPREPVAGGKPNRLQEFARVSGLVTDGSFFPDGRHVVLRTYGTASVYTFPAFDLVGTVRLPSQPQGEGIAVGATGRVLVSSEGVHAEVLRVSLPAALTDPAASASAVPGPAPATAPPAAAADVEKPGRSTGDWVGIGLAAAVVALLGWLTLRGSRVRGPRTR
jgi:hypothetical protein